MFGDAVFVNESLDGSFASPARACRDGADEVGPKRVQGAGRRRLGQRGWTIPARDAGGASAMLWAWSTCPECRDRRWTG